MSEHLRVGDAERANALGQLEQQAAAGRLSGEELRSRRERATTAVYDVDLDALFADLPGGLRPLPRLSVEPPPAAPSGVDDCPYPHQELVVAEPHRSPVSQRQPWEARSRADERAVLLTMVPFGLAGVLFATHHWQIGMMVGALTIFVLFPMLALFLRRRPRG